MEGHTEADPIRPAWQMLVFIAAITVIAGIIMSFVGVAASVIFIGSVSWWCVAGGLAVAVSIALGMAISQYWHVPLVAPIYLVSTTLMGAMLYSLIATVLSVPFIAVFFVLDADGAAWMLLRWGFLAATVLPVAWGLMAGRILVVRREKATLGGRRFRVLLVSDLHLGLLSGTRRLASISRRVRKEKPDMVVIAGDFLDTDPRYLKRFEKKASSMFSSVPVYAVMGNHEYYHNQSASIAWMERMGARVLRNESVVDARTGVTVVGVDDPQAFPSMDMHWKKLEGLIGKGGECLVVSHQPVHFRAASRNGKVLMLSGHTHSGQVWPMDAITRRVYPDGDRGHVTMNGSHMIISAGAGTWGPPMRVGSLSEIVVIDVGA